MNGELPIDVKKRRKVKRVMSDEQKAAAVERLAKARAAKAPTEYKNVHPEVVAKPDTDALCLQNVKAWIKHNREKLSVERKNVRMGMKGAEAREASISGYIRHMEAYLANGMWIDDFYGENGETPVGKVVKKYNHLAYDKHGNVKRTVGVWYCDINTVWTQEMHNEELKQRH